MIKPLLPLFISLSCLFGHFAASAQTDPDDSLAIYNRYSPPTLGNERLDTLLPLLQGRRVALAVNQTSVVGPRQTHLLDTLLALGVDVRKVFTPEHGFRGAEDAGARVTDSRHPERNIPIVSLFGRTLRPTTAQMSDIDVVVFDIQDVGARFYTYISTMHYLMEACATSRRTFIVLDRPNPNDFVDGPVRRPRYRSFVGMHSIPILHGLTIGELALMINGEGWLQSGARCQLTVIPMTGWRHGDSFRLMVKPSPNLPNQQSVRLYPSLCFFEGTCMSVGRGTLFPFQVVGYPAQRAGRFTFTPEPIRGMDSAPLYRGRTCYGDDLRELPFEGGLTLRFLLDFYARMGRDAKTFFNRSAMFDLIAGTDELRRQITSGLSEDRIRSSWQADLDRYRLMRRKYLLYPDTRPETHLSEGRNAE